MSCEHEGHNWVLFKDDPDVAHLEFVCTRCDQHVPGPRPTTPPPYTAETLAEMKGFARGYIHVAMESPLHHWLDEWVTFSEDIDIHFQSNGEEGSPTFGQIEAWGYRRPVHPVTGNVDCTDEVRLI